MSDYQTRDFYNNQGSEWIKSHDSHGFWAEYMKAFNGLLPKGKILEIGAGGGRDAMELINEYHYEYIGIEPAVEMLSVAQERNPKAEFRNIGVGDLDYENEFDGFWSSASLLHIPKANIDNALSKINKALKPGAVGFISLKKHLDNGPDERVEEEGRFFSYWTEDGFSEVLEKNGFEIEQFSERDMGRIVWLVFIVKKVAE